MKKFVIVLIAAVMAIGFSAFTTVKKAPFTLYYKLGGTFHTFTGTACQSGTQIQCQANEPGVGTVPVYTAPNDFSPLMTKP